MKFLQLVAVFGFICLAVTTAKHIESIHAICECNEESAAASDEKVSEKPTESDHASSNPIPCPDALLELKAQELGNRSPPGPSILKENGNFKIACKENIVVLPPASSPEKAVILLLTVYFILNLSYAYAFGQFWGLVQAVVKEQARDAEVIGLRKENDDLKNTIKRLVNEMAEIKKLASNASGNGAAVSASETLIPAPVDDSLKQVISSVSFLTDSVRKIQVPLGHHNTGLGALADRIETIEARMASPATVVQPLLREARLKYPTNAATEEPLHCAALTASLSGNISHRGIAPWLQSRVGPARGRGICTLIDKRLTHLTHDLKLVSGRIAYVMVEILLDAPQRNQRRNSVFVLNIYSKPRDSRQHFKIILKKATDLAGPRPLVVVGDFSAPYGPWGYVYDTTKGRNLWQGANEIDLTLVTDKALPTGIGNSVTRGKTPDFTFIKNVKIRFRKFREEPGRARAPTSLEELPANIRVWPFYTKITPTYIATTPTRPAGRAPL
ncbi:hypothetical protein HPB49_012306 [Dermacentor silvarum]|uniref:Uncharacterized protein n=1 Tax=Dermacentor silvarum TaxID=543639 RepID=A0ACB8CRB9_DERSI|nr:hypothetical protein HPB49_012306 [Dermacentor silvarum]